MSDIFNSSRFKRYQYLIDGYIRNVDKECGLFMNVESGINGIIYAFYPKLLRFNYYDEKMFDVSDDGLVIQGGDHIECEAQTAFVESPDNKGFNKGVHYLSLQNINEEDIDDIDYCFYNIGVLAERDQTKIKDEGEWENTHFSYDNGYTPHSFYKGRHYWNYMDVITVRLDCDEWTVTYYKDNEQVQKDKIDGGKSYHFAVNMCVNQNWVHFKIVDPK